MTVLIRHHYRRLRGAIVCALCGRPRADERHWEAVGA